MTPAEEVDSYHVSSSYEMTLSTQKKSSYHVSPNYAMMLITQAEVVDQQFLAFLLLQTLEIYFFFAVNH